MYLHKNIMETLTLTLHLNKHNLSISIPKENKLQLKAFVLSLKPFSFHVQIVSGHLLMLSLLNIISLFVFLFT